MSLRRVWRGFKFPSSSIARNWPMPSQPHGPPFCARRQQQQQLFCGMQEGGRRIHLHAPRMRIDEIYEHDASSPAARRGVKPTCVSVLLQDPLLERTHRRARYRHCSRSFEGIVSVWSRGSGGLETPNACPERHGRGNLLHPCRPRLAAGEALGYGRSRHTLADDHEPICAAAIFQLDGDARYICQSFYVMRYARAGRADMQCRPTVMSAPLRWQSKKKKKKKDTRLSVLVKN
ncbi:hypothetical protein ACQKWADRAFT_232649 [Trichoderma austrokoningii]